MTGTPGDEGDGYQCVGVDPYDESLFMWNVEDGFLCGCAKGRTAWRPPVRPPVPVAAACAVVVPWHPCL